MAGSDRVKPSSPGLKLTYDDFVLFPDDGKRHEILDGEHYVTPSPKPRHQVIVGNLYFVITSWLEANPIGRLYLSPLDVVMSNVDIVEPDLLYLSNERAAAALTEINVRGIPELLVEIASSGTRKRDEGVKRRLYERAGVIEYWIVDPEVECVRVYRREGDKFTRAIELSREHHDVLVSPLLPGLELSLARIFRN